MLKSHYGKWGQACIKLGSPIRTAKDVAGLKIGDYVTDTLFGQIAIVVKKMKKSVVVEYEDDGEDGVERQSLPPTRDPERWIIGNQFCNEFDEECEKTLF